MIEPFTSEFLTPTKKFRRLSLLLAIHDSPKISQHKIGQATHLSSSMVNNYIKEFQAEELIHVTGKTNRTQSYHLTPSGEKELISLLLSYSSEMVRLYGAAKREVFERMNSLTAEGIESIVLFGAAETAEVVHAALKDTPLIVKGIVDSDPAKQGEKFNGFTILSPDDLPEMEADAVVITSFARQEEIFKRVHQILGPAANIKKLSEI